MNHNQNLYIQINEIIQISRLRVGTEPNAHINLNPPLSVFRPSI